MNVRTPYPGPEFRLVVARGEHVDRGDMENGEENDIAPN